MEVSVMSENTKNTLQNLQLAYLLGKYLSSIAICANPYKEYSEFQSRIWIPTEYWNKLNYLLRLQLILFHISFSLCTPELMANNKIAKLLNLSVWWNNLQEMTTQNYQAHEGLNSFLTGYYTLLTEFDWLEPSSFVFPDPLLPK